MTYTTQLPPQAADVTQLGGKMEPWEFSAFTTAVFRSPQDGDALWKDPEYQAIVKEDTAYMTQGGRLSVAMGQQEVVFQK